MQSLPSPWRLKTRILTCHIILRSCDDLRSNFNCQKLWLFVEKGKKRFFTSLSQMPSRWDTAEKKLSALKKILWYSRALIYFAFSNFFFCFTISENHISKSLLICSETERKRPIFAQKPKFKFVEDLFQHGTYQTQTFLSLWRFFNFFCEIFELFFLSASLDGESKIALWFF